MKKSLFLLGTLQIFVGAGIILTMSYFQTEECKVFSQEYGQEWINSNKYKCNFVSERLNFYTMANSFWTILLTCPIWGGIIMLIYSLNQSFVVSFLRHVTVGAILGILLILAVFQGTFYYIELVDYSSKCPSNANDLGFDCSFIMKNYYRMASEYSIFEI